MYIAGASLRALYTKESSGSILVGLTYVHGWSKPESPVH